MPRLYNFAQFRKDRSTWPSHDAREHRVPARNKSTFKTVKKQESGQEEDWQRWSHPKSSTPKHF